MNAHIWCSISVVNGPDGNEAEILGGSATPAVTVTDGTTVETGGAEVRPAPPVVAEDPGGGPPEVDRVPTI